MILSQGPQRPLDLLPDLGDGGEGVGHLAVVPHTLVHRLHLVRHHVRPLALLKRVSAQHPFSHLWWVFPWPLKQVDEGVPVSAVQPEGLLLPGHRDLVHVLAQLDLWLVIHGDQLEDATKRWLSLAGHKVGSNSKCRDLVPLLIQRKNCLFVDVVGGGDDQLFEPVKTVLYCHPIELLFHNAREVSQVTRVYPDSKRPVAQIVERHCNGTEVEDAAPCHIICVDESNEALGEGEGVADEGGELAVVRLAGQDVEVLPKLAPPSLAHCHKILLSRRLPVLPVLHRFLLCHGQLPCAQLFDAGEGGDKGVGMGATHRNSKKLASEHVGGAVETTYVGISRSRETTIGSLSTSQSKLKQLDVLSRRNTEPCSICGDQRGVVDEGKEGGLEQLDDDEGPRDGHERDSREADRALGQGGHRHLAGGELLQEVVELLLHVARQHRLQVADVRLGVVEVLQELETIRQAGKDGEFPFERVLPKVQVEGGDIVYLARLPIGVSHGDLVEVGEQGLHDRVFETELRISLLAVLRRPRGEHLILEGASGALVKMLGWHQLTGRLS